jgi:putative membrane protein
MEIPILPTINASLNAFAGIFLILGFIAIKTNNQLLHKKMMLSAFSASSLFMISYLTYHWLVPGVTKYEGEGILRGLYFFILITHSPLAALVVPLAIWALVLAIKGRFEQHKKVTRILFPTWAYVSITGVLIYLMLYIF